MQLNIASKIDPTRPPGAPKRQRIKPGRRAMDGTSKRWKKELKQREVAKKAAAAAREAAIANRVTMLPPPVRMGLPPRPTPAPPSPQPSESEDSEDSGAEEMEGVGAGGVGQEPRASDEVQRNAAQFMASATSGWGTVHEPRLNEFQRKFTGLDAVDPENANHAVSMAPPTTTTHEELALRATSSWADSGLSAQLVRHLTNGMGFEGPTAIQAAALKPLLQSQERRRDVVIKAATGSGKTLAFMVPIVADILAAGSGISRGDGITALVLVPTRELALQVLEVVQELLKPWVFVVAGVLSGGEKKKAEKARLRKGLNILISTPGRLLDHVLHTKALDLSTLKWLVLDEADRLLDMGFEPVIRDIIKAVPESRSSVLASATMRDQVARFASSVLKTNALRLGFSAAAEHVEPARETFALPSTLAQSYVETPLKWRLIALIAFLKKTMRDRPSASVVVFFSSCASVDYHTALFGMRHGAQTKRANAFTRDEEANEFAELLSGGKSGRGGGGAPDMSSIIGAKLLGDDVKVWRLHGNMPQSNRTRSFGAFTEAASTEGPGGVLFCTDVAARGLDFPAVDIIVQYDTPGDPYDYIHRVGRTARMGASGEALLFLNPSERTYLTLLAAQGVKGLRARSAETILMTLGTGKDAKTARKPLGGAYDLQWRLERSVAGDKRLHGMATDAYSSTVRAYATHPAATKHIFRLASLHLGHMAKSFALREAPTAIGANAGARISAAKAGALSMRDRKTQDRARKARVLPVHESLPGEGSDDSGSDGSSSEEGGPRKRVRLSRAEKRKKVTGSALKLQGRALKKKQYQNMRTMHKALASEFM